MVRSQSITCTPNSGKITEHKTCSGDSIKGSDYSKRLSQTSWADGILHRTDSKCTSVHEANSVASVEFLETVKRSIRHGHSFYSTSRFSSEMVASFSQHHERPITSTIYWGDNSHDRCFKTYVRRSFGKQLCARVLDERTIQTSHKFIGIKGSSSLSEAFYSQNSGENCISENRQYNSSPVYKQTRGHKSGQSLHGSMESMAVCSAKQFRSESCSLARVSKQICRSTESTQNTEYRMDIGQESSNVNFSRTGNTNDGSICITDKPSDSSVLLLVSKQTSVCDRCLQHCMGKHVCLCFSTNMSYSKSDKSHTEIQLSSDSNSTIMAETTLVSRSAGSVSCNTNKTSKQSFTVDTTKDLNLPSTTRNVKLSGLAPVSKRFKEIGFSEKSRKLLLAAWRTGTQKDYTNKFKCYDSWCSSREINPYGVSIVQVAEFIAYLFDKGLQYSTINGYRSMLSAVLPCIDGHKVGQHPYIIQMLKGVFNSRPPQVRLLPEWDLLKVLEALQKNPFEPLNKANLKMITFKTVFIIAITSFRRCSDLQSFSLGQTSVNIQSKGITFIRHGLAKQDRQSHRKATVFIPAFGENKKLDPKRCIYYYLKATERFRKNPDGTEETKVFLGLNEPHRPVSVQTISHWIVETIRICLNDKHAKVKAHSTRALGPSLALFRGASIESIMNSADWSSETTFVRAYLRDLNCNTSLELLASRGSRFTFLLCK